MKKIIEAFLYKKPSLVQLSQYSYDFHAIYWVWRSGQTTPVFAYYVMEHGTMEEKIYKRQT
ncbi:putative DNA helicase [Helianthus annuus]|nr:putative DNA helicase [Helianthus annuus]